MSKAHVDPAELRRFASDLKRFNTELTTLLAGLNGRLQSLEASWRDQEQKKFEEAFRGTLKVFQNFLQEGETHVSSLNKRAAVIEEYLKQR